MQAFLRHWLNFHRVLWILTLVSFFIAWNRGLALLYGLFALLVALLLISYLMPRWQLRNIGVTRSFTGHFTAGQPGRITYMLASGGARYHVEISELLAFAEQREQHHFFSRISGRTSCTLQFNCLHRGCYPLQDIQLLSAYPFGIVKFHKSIETEAVEILVFPKVVELSRIPTPVVADATTWGEVLIPQQGGRDEFAAVREYRHGDELSRIHWPVSARYQNLVVKEYEQTDRPAMLVVLDGHQRFNVGQGHRSTFEYAVTIAASMIRFASREGVQCFLVSHTDHLHELTIEAYCGDFHTLYEALARLNCEGRHLLPGGCGTGPPAVSPGPFDHHFSVGYRVVAADIVAPCHSNRFGNGCRKLPLCRTAGDNNRTTARVQPVDMAYLRQPETGKLIP